MLPQQRRMKIIDLLKEEGSARVKYLSNLLSVSEPTIRQDLERLEEEGLIIREHGGAYLKSLPEQVRSLTLQHTENMDKKKLIGHKAVEFIDNESSIILDSGTTVTEIAKNLDNKQNLRIITNSLNIALLLGANYSFDVMVTGGDFKPPTLSLTGEKAASFFDHLHVDKLFLAAGGISPAEGITYPGFNDIAVKKAMVKSATEVYLVADSTKIGKICFASLGPVDITDYLITDNEISNSSRRDLEKKGVKVIIAE
ncbi:MAG: DeoR/GlpR transcriptional regulator [Spirochaetales bacterium]|nr:DeoR/GlpR transcriptional regulator [Spirochaetales bacterium]